MVNERSISESIQAAITATRAEIEGLESAIALKRQILQELEKMASAGSLSVITAILTRLPGYDRVPEPDLITLIVQAFEDRRCRMRVSGIAGWIEDHGGGSVVNWHIINRLLRRHGHLFTTQGRGWWTCVEHQAVAVSGSYPDCAAGGA